ncbi:hypothetical protein LTR65_004829 [Meristemomyces frigidus]
MDNSALEDVTGMSVAGDVSMMDNMDDLFGEAADGLGMGPGVVKLAWSNTGGIAQISKDGNKITVRTMARDHKTGVHSLSEESRFPIEAPEGRQYVHLHFNGPGVDVAAVDGQGGIHLYTVAGAIGRMQSVPGESAITNGDRSDLDAVVGMHWLPLYPMKTPYITPATKGQSKWVTQMRHPDQHSSRVHHPAENKNALLFVTSNCKLALSYQNESGAWQSISTELEGWTTTEDMLSHAAIGDDGDHLVLVTYDEARRLRLYKITINWNSSQQSNGNIRYITVAPTLDIGHLTALEHVAPQHLGIATLSHLRVIPRPPDIAGQGTPCATTVLAVYTHAPLPTSVAQQHQDCFSVVARWNIESTVPTLHDSFTKLKSNGPTPVHAAVTVLRRQPDMMSNKLILTVDIQYHNTLIAFSASDGGIEFRDRLTWSTIDGFGDATTASSLPQSGLGYFPGDHVAQVAHSPDGSAIAVMDSNGLIRVKAMTLLSGWQALDDGISDNRSLVETAVVCLARQYAILSSSSTCSDETLALLPPDLAPDMRVLFVTQVIRIMCRYIDVSMLDHQRQQRAVLGEPLLSRAMSAQLVLGTKLGTNERTFAGQFAYGFLNLKLISMALAQSLTRDNATVSRSDLVPSLAGLIKWGIDALLYMIDSIAQLKRTIQPGVSAKQAAERFVASTGNAAMHLLLCSFPRVLLRMHILSTPQYLRLAHAWIPRARSIEESQKLNGIYDFAKSIPVNFNAFPEFITEVDGAVRNAYTEAGVSGERRMEIELAMMTEGHIPDELVPALQTILDTILPNLCESADMGKMYFWQTQWLGIEQAVPAEGTTLYDAIRKTPLANGMKLRVCRRCGAHTEDVSQEQVRQLPAWLQHGQRQCYCQSYWWLE